MVGVGARYTPCTQPITPMKTRFLSAVALTLGFNLSTAACDFSPGKTQNNADQARIEADAKAVQAQRDTDEARLKAEAEVKQKQDVATQALVAAKTEYHAKVASLISDIDKRVGDLRAANLSATPAKKQKNEESIVLLSGRRTVTTADDGTIDLATAGSWDGVKGSIDKNTADTRTALAKT